MDKQREDVCTSWAYIMGQQLARLQHIHNQPPYSTPALTSIAKVGATQEAIVYAKAFDIPHLSDSEYAEWEAAYVEAYNAAYTKKCQQLEQLQREREARKKKKRPEK